ncbi:MAG: hypothetical protein J6R44_01100 [Clostridia bacterium]|nr:hypothetical protein [Clostridia bacterium]
MEIIAKDKLIPIIKQGVKMTSVDQSRLSVKAKYAELYYRLEFSPTVSRKNMLNAVCAMSYLNWKYGEFGNPCYFTYDNESKKISVNLKCLVDEREINANQIKTQIEIIQEAYECTEIELNFLLEGNETGEDFVDDIMFPSSPEKITAKEQAKRKLVENFVNASKAFGGDGKGSDQAKTTALLRICIGGAEKQYPTFRVYVREEKRVITITHLMPTGCELERGLDVAMAVSKLNSKLEYGTFDLDLFHGRLVYRASFDISDVVISQAKYQEIVGLIGLSFNKYYLTLAKYLKGQMQIKEFISHLERN